MCCSLLPQSLWDLLIQKAPHWALSSVALMFLKIQVSYLTECPSIWVCLMFLHGYISVMGFWQECPRSDAVMAFSVHHTRRFLWRDTLR